MPHELLKKHELSPYDHPLLVTLRYRCGCTGKEVITIQNVLDLNMSRERFLWTMDALWKDMRIEVQQHIKP